MWPKELLKKGLPMSKGALTQQQPGAFKSNFEMKKHTMTSLNQPRHKVDKNQQHQNSLQLCDAT